MTPLGVVEVREPLPWAALLAYLQPRLTPLMERVDTDRYYRRVGGAWLEVRYDAASHSLRLRADRGVGDPADALRRVARLFAADADNREAASHLRHFPIFAGALRRLPGLRPLGCWSAFELCLRTVIGQQVTVTAAGTLMRRLLERCGEPTPAAVLSADLDGIGMPGRRVATLRALADAVARGALDPERGGWQEIDAALQALPGFGPWTRGYLAIRLGREADAFPHTDIGLIRAAGASSPRDLLRQAEAWRPFRSLAAACLWMSGGLPVPQNVPPADAPG